MKLREAMIQKDNLSELMNREIRSLREQVLEVRTLLDEKNMTIEKLCQENEE
jgi:Mg2+ and Co2+ transporter CorA